MPDESNFAEVLHRLLQALVDDSRAVDLEASPLKGRLNWCFNCDVNDVGKVVGKKGVRLRALRLVVELAGQLAGSIWFLQQPLEPKGERREGENVSANRPAAHDAEGDRQLLADLVKALEIDVRVAVTGNVATGFTFALTCAGVGDNVKLLDQHRAVYSASQVETQPINLMATLGTLMRAVGARQGVKYVVAIAT